MLVVMVFLFRRPLSVDEIMLSKFALYFDGEKEKCKYGEGRKSEEASYLDVNGH